MVSRRRRNISTLAPRRNSRRTTNLRRQLALVAHRLPAKSRIPRDPPPTVPGFDYTVKIPFLVNMFWPSNVQNTSFAVLLPATPIASGSINLRARNTIDNSDSNRSYWLDYEEIFASAYMRATGVDITQASATTKASLDFALVSVKVWGPALTSATLQLRCDGDSTVTGFAGQDKPGRNHRAATGCTYPAIGWRKFGAVDATTPAVLVTLSRVSFQQFAPQAAGTSFGLDSPLDFGEVHCTVRIRYKLAVSTTTGLSGKAATVFDAVGLSPTDS